EQMSRHPCRVRYCVRSCRCRGAGDGTRWRALQSLEARRSRNSVRRGCWERRSSMKQLLTAIIEREDNSYVALCPELDIASQGDSVESARANLREALE